MRDDARVHHAIPERRDVREQDHRRVAGRQLRRVVEVAQRLIRARRIRMMIRVSLQLIQEQVRDDVIAVPRMLRRAALVATVRQPAPAEPVVLDVVHDFEQRRAVHGLDHEKRDHHHAADRNRDTPYDDRHRPRMQHLVAPGPRRAAEPRETRAFEPPRGAHAADDGTRQEGPERFAVTCARGILGGRDAHVMPAVVLDEEVSVCDRRQRNLREPALEAVRLVPEFMRGVDRDARRRAERQREADVVVPRQRMRADDPHAHEERDVLDERREIDDQAVVALAFEVRHDVFGRVVAVVADQRVENRNHAEREQRAEPPEHVKPRRQRELRGEDRQRDRQRAEQP